MPETMPVPQHDIRDLPDEQWLPVPEYETWYEISNLGRVKSLGTSRNHRPRILRENVKHHGYRSVTLYRGTGQQRRVAIHRLVLTAFVGECPEGHEACHRDSDPANNRLANLYWGTSAENKQDMIRRGTNFQTQKASCPQGHPYDEANTIRYRNGWRRCRACRQLAKIAARKAGKR